MPALCGLDVFAPSLGRNPLVSLPQTIKLVEILTKAENIYDDAENMVDNWGNWVQCGVDAANIICDASQIWGYGC